MSGSNGASVSFPSPGKLETFLSGLPPEALKVLLDISYPVGYPEHALVISEDQPCQAVFMLHSGRAKLSTKSRDGKRVMLRIASPGEILGLSSVLLGVGYDITAETLARSVVRVTKREDFLDFLRSYADLSCSLLAPLASEYEAALDSLRSLAWFPTATARVAQLLLHMCEERKDSEAKAKLLLTQEQIAQMTATSRETVTRLFSQLKRDRIISIRGSDLIIRDRMALEKMAC
ncbi:MAG TPA: Crp/Fnr family transcriptional regulator [Terriglobales bacterium]|nr:Crp/Fnr family transcriptional regulator [Terriglobales bacterium]